MIIKNIIKKYLHVTCLAPTSPYSQKTLSACELVVSAAGSNIYTLTLNY